MRENQYACRAISSERVGAYRHRCARLPSPESASLSAMSNRPTPRAPTHKERLLKQGFKQFYEHGFAGTSLETVLVEAGVPKGSFYHHFGSKETFALAVLQLYYEKQQERRKRWFSAPDMDEYEMLTGYLDDLVSDFTRTGAKRGCLVGKLSLELANTSEAFGSLFSTMLGSWHNSVEQVIARGQHAGTVSDDLPAGQLADTILATIQGALILDLTHRRIQAMRSISAVMASLLRPSTTETRAKRVSQG